ncbi:MAG: nitroreductase family protein [Planctomycetota bacterium]
MESLSVVDAIRRRRSIKRFRPEPIPPPLLTTLIELTVQAPSSFNLQPWRIVVVQDAAQRQLLRAAAFNQPQVTEAPVVLVFAVSLGGWRQDLESVIAQGIENGTWSERYGDYMRRAVPAFQDQLGRQQLLREYGIKDAVIAATHTALAAESLGLGSCFMNGWIEAQVKAAIGAGDDPDIAIAVVLPIGYAETIPANPGRLPMCCNVYADRIDQPFGGASDSKTTEPE